MQAKLIQRERFQLGDDSFADVVIWQVPQPVSGSRHCFKYRLALVVREVCVVRYDNETGKGDHKHTPHGEAPYGFTTLDQLIEDFWAEAARL